MRNTCVLFFAATLTWAAEPAQPPGAARPKIGVALAGGAALGLSHVGVLQWLEENRIPVDYIAGTSMGGLVAGIHASGLNSAEMIAFVEQVDWQMALASTSPYRDLSFRRKEDAAQFPMPFEMGLKNWKVNLPSGLSPGEGVGLVIDRFAAPYSNMRSFNDLPTPFRCVASNLATGRGVVFDKGSFFDALRATMSLPALFAPVSKDGMVLVDGGLTDNLPVDVVRKMGADIVIAVALDVPKDPKDFQSLLGVAGRSISYMISENERPSIAAADIVVMPLLKGMSAGDYTKWAEFRKLGYTAAEQKAVMLKKFQISQAEYDTFSKARQAKRRPNTIRPEQVIVEGDVAPRLKEAVIATLMPKPGTSLDRDVLENQMLKLTGTGRFDTASYEFANIGGKEVLKVQVHEKTYGPPFLKPAIFLDGANGEGLRFGIGARLTFLDFGGPASEWRSDFSIGTYNRLGTEYYYRIKGGKWFVAPRAGYARDSFPLYGQNGDKLADYNETTYGAGVDLGYAFGRAQELRMGYQYGYLKTTLETGTNVPQDLNGHVGLTNVLFRRDTRDNPLVPTSGNYLLGRVSWADTYPGVSRQFPLYEGGILHARPLKPKYSFIGRVTAASTVNETSLYNMFKMGGLFNMSALSRQQLLGNNMYFGSAYFLRSLSGDSISLFGKFYGLIGYEIGRAWFPGMSAKPRQDGIIGLVGATQFGIVFFGGSIGDQGDMKILFRLGRTF
jgi:NTE family protein